MKSIFYAIIFIAIQAYFTSAIAKNNAVISTHAAEINATDELAKLKQEKLAIDANLKKQEIVCYKKFAVSDCLKDAKTEAQAALNKVKRREIEIKDLHRNNKAESDLNKKENAAGENVAKNTAKNSDEVTNSETKVKTAKVAKVAKPARTIQTDAKVLAEKSVNDKLRADAAKKRLEKSNQKLAASQKKAQSRANKNNQSAANTAAYNQKMVQAESHKAALEKKNLERKKAKSAPLPLRLPDSIPTAKEP